MARLLTGGHKGGEQQHDEGREGHQSDDSEKHIVSKEGRVGLLGRTLEDASL